MDHSCQATYAGTKVVLLDHFHPTLHTSTTWKLCAAYSDAGGRRPLGSKLLLNLPEKDLARIETLIKAGEYTTKNEFVRFAVKQLLYSEGWITVPRMSQTYGTTVAQPRSKIMIDFTGCMIQQLCHCVEAVKDRTIAP